MKLAALRNPFARPAAYLRAEWERMAPRERKWVGALSAAVVAVSAALGIYLVVESLGNLGEHNADVREALAAIAKHRDEYLEAKARSVAQEVRIGTEPPQLQADLETAAREVTIQIPESNERPATPAGRRYVEHSVDVKLRQVDLGSLADFLRKLETGPRLITVTRLSLKRRFSEPEKLDVELTATAFERVREAAAKNKKPVAEAGGRKAP